MNSLLAQVLAVLALAGGMYGLGYCWEAGRGRATKYKKVCDICFRDIHQVNEFLRRQGDQEEAEIRELLAKEMDR
jgi:hypothetical protein